MTTTITVTKIEAARRQLRTAIELWFSDGDPVAIHTLSAAAHQIVHDLNIRNNGPDLLLNTKFIKDQYKNEFSADIKRASNFMKHADRDKGGTAAVLEFTPNSNDNFIMWTIFGIKYLGENLGAEEIAFERWQMFQNPDLLADAGKELFKHSFTVEQLNIVRATPKRNFLDTFRLVVSQANAAQGLAIHGTHPTTLCSTQPTQAWNSS